MAQQKDTMGFPVEGQGGSAVNPVAMSELGGGLKAGFQGVHNGMLMGFGDNVNGALSAVLSNPAAPDYLSGMGDRYAGSRDAYREQYAQNQADHPAELAAGNLGGMVGASVPTMAYATGKGLLGTMMRGAGIGGVEGGVQGAGYADGQDVVSQAGRGALLGATLGGAVPAVVAGAKAMADPLTGFLDSLVNRANQAKVARAVGGAARAANMGPAEIDAALAAARAEGQLEYRAMDAMGIPGQRQASGVARAGGDAASEIAAYLESRQIGQSERVGSFVDDAFGTKGTTAAKTASDMNATRKATNNTNFTAAREGAGPVNLNDTVDAIDTLMNRNPILGESALTNTEMGNRLATLRGQLQKGGSQLINFDTVLNVKEDLGKVIGRIKKAGEEIPHELAQVYGKIDSALEASSPAYRAANDAALKARKEISAIETGSDMASRGRAADNVPAFQAMSPGEQQAARIGYGDNLLNSLERNPALTANKAKPLSLSPKRQAEAAAIAIDPDLYARRLARENQMWETQNRALGGSRTADNLQDISGAAGQAFGAAKAAASLNIGEAVSKIAGLLAPFAKGQNEATRALIAKALMAGDANALIPLIRREANGQTRDRLVEALMRGMGQQGSQQ